MREKLDCSVLLAEVKSQIAECSGPDHDATRGVLLKYVHDYTTLSLKACSSLVERLGRDPELVVLAIEEMHSR